MKAEETVEYCKDEHCQPFCHRVQAKISFKAGIGTGYSAGKLDGKIPRRCGKARKTEHSL